MTQLLILLRSLPKVLQDLIGEYNVEHRPKMKLVLEELSTQTPYSLTCSGCGIGKIGICLYSYVSEDFVCSEKCIKDYVESLPFHMQGWYYSKGLVKKKIVVVGV